MSYTELSVEERATIQIGRTQGFSLRRIACLINRSPSTISRELRRNRGACGGYSARLAQQQMQARRQVCRPMRKLLPGSERFELVTHMLRERLSPEQIAGKLRRTYPTCEMPTSVARRSTTRSMPCQWVSCVRS
jgi:IS30 family transposase